MTYDISERLKQYAETPEHQEYLFHFGIYMSL